MYCIQPMIRFANKINLIRKIKIVANLGWIKEGWPTCAPHLDLEILTNFASLSDLAFPGQQEDIPTSELNGI